MNHRHYEELLHLYFYDELDRHRKTSFETHLQSCSMCQKELEDLKLLSAVLANYNPACERESLVREARAELNRNLGSEMPHLSFKDRLTEFINGIFPTYKTVLAGAALASIGLILGYLLTPKTAYEISAASAPAQYPASFGEPMSSAPIISNVRFINSGAYSRNIEFTFDAVMPVRMSGSTDDPNIQKILAHALISEQNPGVRLQSVSALTSDPNPPRLEDDLLDALISAIRYDKNPGVRQAAIEALQPYKMEPKVRQGLLDVLIHDESAGLRIAAINILSKPNGVDISRDSIFVQLLQTKLKNDTNNYIRMRSHAVLKEMKP